MEVVADKNIWITGASSGIGKALALQLVERGNTVFISARNHQVLEEMAAANRGLIVVHCDVTDESSVGAAVSVIRGHVDSLDALILSAGTCEYVDNANLSLPLFKRVFEVNFFAAVRCLHAALPMLRRAQRRGLVVGVSSLSTVAGFPRAEAYGSSKAAFQYLMDSLRLDLAEQKIDVLVVQPGFIDTPMTAANDFPMPFMRSVDYSAAKILRAMDKRKMHLSFPWQLSSLLRCAASIKTVWYRWIGPVLVRNNRL